MSVQAAENRLKSGSLDYGLLLQRLEKRLLTGDDSEEAIRILKREEIWQELPDEPAIEWARLAQAAGLPELSLAVLSLVTARSPQCVRAWQARVELLELLGRREAPNLGAGPGVPERADSDLSPEADDELAPNQPDPAPWDNPLEPATPGCEVPPPPGSTIPAPPRGTVPTTPSGTIPPLRGDEGGCNHSSTLAKHPPALFDGGTTSVHATELDSWDPGVDAPFTLMRSREAGLERFLELFRGREECFARQWADRKAGTQGYVPVRRPMTTEDVLDHLRGHRTYGIYLLQQDSRVRLGVIDADLVSRFRTGAVGAAEKDLVRRENRYLLSRLAELSAAQGLPCLIEFSGGKGFHFWYLFEGPVAAPLARQALQGLARRLAPDLSCFSLEVFPKQDQLAGKGLGNLVKLPLGVHRMTGRPSHFLHLSDRSPWEQLKVLDRVRLIKLEALHQVEGGGPKGELLVHPRQEQWAKDYPELALLCDRCPALGQIVVSCREARTLSVREEKVLLGTLGFLPRARTLLHHLLQNLPDYNPHLVDYRLSRLRGKPLGCRRIHGLLELTIDQCAFPAGAAYNHPLLHWPDWAEGLADSRAERPGNLRDALVRLREAMSIVDRMLAPRSTS